MLARDLAHRAAGERNPPGQGLEREHAQCIDVGSAADFLTGDWAYAILGVRSDIRYLIDPSAVIADASGVVQVSGFQDNVTPMKVWARFGFQVISPVTPAFPGGAKAFAKSDLHAASGVAPTEASADEGSARGKKA